MVQPNPFPPGTSTAAPDPSKLWDSSLQAPYPTNAPWQNYVLNKGSAPEVVHPYIVRSSTDAGDGGLVVSYPNRGVDKNFIFQAFVPDITIHAVEGLGSHRVLAYDDLSVTLKWGSGFTAPLVRGSPYVTCICDGITPAISTIHAVLNLSSNEEKTKHKLHLNSGQTWIVYTSSPLPFGADLKAVHQFNGVLRIALLPSLEDEDVLDSHRWCYPTGGSADFSRPYQVSYQWKTASWQPDAGTLVMLSLPIHRQILVEPHQGLGKLRYNTMDGHTEAWIGSTWTLKEPAELTTGWTEAGAALAPGSDGANEVADAVRADVEALNRIDVNASYWAGKLFARAARLALIAEELGMDAEKRKVVRVLRSGLLGWFDLTLEGNGLLHDRKWGGIVSQDGARNAGADFGNGVYNDHHFHWGYFLYAGAVLAKLDPRWGSLYKSHLYTLMYDIMNSGESPQFPRLRHFDPWVLHSWASGVTEFADGRNQESTSEAVNAYYGAALLGLAYQDTELEAFARTLTAFEIRATRTLWHVPSSSEIYEASFVKEQRMIGVLWANKADTGLWFAPGDQREKRTGIQIIPVTPILSSIFPDHKFVNELVEWTRPSVLRPGVEEGWKGFFYSLEAITNKQEALASVRQLSAHDDGNSLSNTLWWIHTRSHNITRDIPDFAAKLSHMSLTPSSPALLSTPTPPPNLTTDPPPPTYTPPPTPDPSPLTLTPTYSWASARPPSPLLPPTHETLYDPNTPSPFQPPPNPPFEGPPSSEAPPQTPQTEASLPSASQSSAPASVPDSSAASPPSSNPNPETLTEETLLPLLPNPYTTYPPPPKTSQDSTPPYSTPPEHAPQLSQTTYPTPPSDTSAFPGYPPYPKPAHETTPTPPPVSDPYTGYPPLPKPPLETTPPPVSDPHTAYPPPPKLSPDDPNPTYSLPSHPPHPASEPQLPLPPQNQDNTPPHTSDTPTPHPQNPYTSQSTSAPPASGSQSTYYPPPSSTPSGYSPWPSYQYPSNTNPAAQQSYANPYPTSTPPPTSAPPPSYTHPYGNWGAAQYGTQYPPPPGGGYPQQTTPQAQYPSPSTATPPPYSSQYAAPGSAPNPGQASVLTGQYPTAPPYNSPGTSAYGAPPSQGQSTSASPYPPDGQSTAASPYGAPPPQGQSAATPYGAPPPQGQSTAASPYGAPQGQSTAASPYGAPPPQGQSTTPPYGAPPPQGQSAAASPYGAPPPQGQSTGYQYSYPGQGHSTSSYDQSPYAVPPGQSPNPATPYAYPPASSGPPPSKPGKKPSTENPPAYVQGQYTPPPSAGGAYAQPGAPGYPGAPTGSSYAQPGVPTASPYAQLGGPTAGAYAQPGASPASAYAQPGQPTAPGYGQPGAPTGTGYAQTPYGAYPQAPSYPPQYQQYPGYTPQGAAPGYGYPPQQPYGAYPGYPPAQPDPYYKRY